MVSNSQIGQDLEVISFYNSKTNLYFVDIGANDGITLSNTFLLEKKYNWKGICSEPLPSVLDKLRSIRNVYCDTDAVFNKTGLSLKFSESTLYSGITNYIDKHMFAKNGNQIDVKTITLQDLLKKYNSPNIINYLSLDTEGSELEILKSVNFSDYTFLYIDVEHNFIEPRRTEIKNLLLNNNYLYRLENRFDDSFIHETVITGIYYLQKNYTRPITIKRKGEDFLVSSSYWDEDRGTFDNGHLTFQRLGKGKVYFTHIDFGNDNIWDRDQRI